MDIVNYTQKLSNMNWNYKKETNPYRWQEGLREYERMNRLSFTNPEFRRVWIESKLKYMKND